MQTLSLPPPLISQNPNNDDKIVDDVAPPPKPYAFGYAAGRFPGHIDRTHSEVSDGAGTVQGSYSYVDPHQRIRTVDYTADRNGFHPIVSGGDEEQHENVLPPRDTDVVAAAKQRHLAQYANIARTREGRVPVDTVAVSQAKQRHLNLFQKIAEEHARIAAERGDKPEELLTDYNNEGAAYDDGHQLQLLQQHNNNY